MISTLVEWPVIWREFLLTLKMAELAACIFASQRLHPLCFHAVAGGDAGLAQMKRDVVRFRVSIVNALVAGG